MNVEQTEKILNIKSTGKRIKLSPLTLFITLSSLSPSSSIFISFLWQSTQSSFMLARWTLCERGWKMQKEISYRIMNFRVNLGQITSSYGMPLYNLHDENEVWRGILNVQLLCHTSSRLRDMQDIRKSVTQWICTLSYDFSFHVKENYKLHCNIAIHRRVMLRWRKQIEMKFRGLKSNQFQCFFVLLLRCKLNHVCMHLRVKDAQQSISIDVIIISWWGRMEWTQWAKRSIRQQVEFTLTREPQVLSQHHRGTHLLS